MQKLSLVVWYIRQLDTGMQPLRTASYLKKRIVQQHLPENQRRIRQVVCWLEPV